MQVCEFQDVEQGVTAGMDDSPINSRTPLPMGSFYAIPGITDTFAEPSGVGSQVYRILGVPTRSKSLLKGYTANGTISWQDAQSVRH